MSAKKKNSKRVVFTNFAESFAPLAEMLVSDGLESHDFFAYGEEFGLIVANKKSRIRPWTKAIRHNNQAERAESLQLLMQAVRGCKDLTVLGVWMRANAAVTRENGDREDMRVVNIVGVDGSYQSAVATLSREVKEGLLTHVSPTSYEGTLTAQMLAAVRGTQMPSCHLCEDQQYVEPYGPVLDGGRWGGLWRCIEMEQCNRSTDRLTEAEAMRRLCRGAESLISLGRTPEERAAARQDMRDLGLPL